MELYFAFFYCDSQDVSKQGLYGLLSSILWQLCTQSSYCYDILCAEYSAHRFGTQKPRCQDLKRCLVEVITHREHDPIYIIVDALDECPSGLSSECQHIMELLRDLCQLASSNLRICITSRQERDIQMTIGPFVHHSLSLHSEAGQEQDIVVYIRSVMQNSTEFQRWREREKNLVTDTLCQKEGGRRIWCYTSPAQVIPNHGY